MNVERLHALIVMLRSDLQQTGILNRLYELQGALQELINQPDPQRQEAVGRSLVAVEEAINRSEVAGFSPAWSALLKEIGFHGVLGAPLREHLEAVTQRTHLTPSVAKDEIQGWVNELERLQSVIEGVGGGFAEMKISEEELEEGECEVGFMIPGAAVEHRLDLLTAELTEFESIFRTFSEIATETPQRFEVRSVSSGEFTVFLRVETAVAAMVATALDRVVGVYRQLLKIRELRAELSKEDVPGEVFEKLDAHANAKMMTAIDDIAIELVLEYYPSEDGRRARQLVAELKGCLCKIANRIDRGYSFDVRTRPIPAAVGEGSEEADLAMNPRDRAIRDAKPALQFIRPEGEPILSLSEKATAPKAAPRKTRVKKTAAKKAARKGATPRKKKKKAVKKKAVAKKKTVTRETKPKKRATKAKRPGKRKARSKAKKREAAVAAGV